MAAYTFKQVTTPLFYIYDHIGTSHQLIRAQLKSYKTRWNQSAAEHLIVITHPSEATLPIPIITAEYRMTDFSQPQLGGFILLDALNQFTHYHIRQALINPTVEYTKDPIRAAELLNSLPATFSFDTETASKYSDDEIKEMETELATIETEYNTKLQHWQKELTTELALGTLANDKNILKFKNNIASIPNEKLEATQSLRSQLASNALVMAKNQTTMYSFAASEQTAFVISSELDTDQLVLDFLTTTKSTVVMHNAMYDMRLVYNRTGKFITNFEDTQLMYATLKNNTNSFLAKVGLKGLAGHIYKDWAVSKDLFGIEHKYNQELIHYSGVDAMATMFLYNEATIQLSKEL